jgi:hypothetical protein
VTTLGVTVLTSTIGGGVTPICNSCGTTLCWDISENDYAEAQQFWDNWVCKDCNGGVKMSLKQYKGGD